MEQGGRAHYSPSTVNLRRCLEVSLVTREHIEPVQLDPDFLVGDRPAVPNVLDDASGRVKPDRENCFVRDITISMM